MNSIFNLCFEPSLFYLKEHRNYRGPKGFQENTKVSSSSSKYDPELKYDVYTLTGLDKERRTDGAFKSSV